MPRSEKRANGGLAKFISSFGSRAGYEPEDVRQAISGGSKFSQDARGRNQTFPNSSRRQFSKPTVETGPRRGQRDLARAMG